MSKCHAISQTDEDRSWRRNPEVMDRIDRLLDAVEEHPDNVFYMDAQMLCLKNDPAARSHRRDEILRHISDGRLLVGPWSVQNDFNLCSGEAAVRNLLIGSTLAEEWDGCRCLSDAPDAAGGSGQLPQIYAGFNIHHSHDAQRWAAGENPDIHTGLAGGGAARFEQDELSLRPHLKILNMRCQNLLELVLEPLYTHLNQWTDGDIEYPSDLLDDLWMELQKNHAYDSICGCNPVGVSQDEENRYLRILDTAEKLRGRGLLDLVHRIDRRGMDLDGYLLTVVNTLPYERAEMVEAWLYPSENDDHDAFGLFDEDGKAIEFELQDLGTVITPNDMPLPKSVRTYCIRFRIAVPACGYRTLRVCPQSCFPEVGTILRPAPVGFVMQNEYMRVTVGADGSVDLLDSETGIESPNLFGFDDVADKGESGRFAPDPASGAIDCAAKPDVSIVENRGVRLVYPFGVTLHLSLNPGCRHLCVDVRTKPNNHRLRLLMHTDVHDETCISSLPFDCVRRSNLHESSDVRDDWSEPNNGLVSVRDWNKQVTIFNNGLYEYEHLRDSRGTIALTLMNSTGSDDKGPAPDAPGNRCVRKLSYRLAIRPGQAADTRLMQEMQCFHVPMLAFFDTVDSRMFNDRGGDADDSELQERGKRLQDRNEKKLPLTQEGLILDDLVVFSALKRSHDCHAWILRFFNPAVNAVDVSEPAFSAEVSELDERKGGKPWSIERPVGAKEIVTLRF